MKFKTLMSSVAILLMVFATACTALTPVKNLISSDLAAFQANANQFGTPTDQLCADALTKQWLQMDLILADDSGGIVAAAYRAMLVQRMSQLSQQIVVQNCGQFAAELALAIARRGR